MKKIALLLPMLTLLPLAAQDWEAGVFGGQQSYRSPGAAENNLIVPGTPEHKTVYGLRAGYSVVDLGPVLLQVTGGFQPQASTSVVSVVNNQGFPTVASVKTFTTQNWAVGGDVQRPGLLDRGRGPGIPV